MTILLTPIFTKGHVKTPVLSVFNSPVLADRIHQALGIRAMTGDVQLGLPGLDARAIAP